MHTFKFPWLLVTAIFVVALPIEARTQSLPSLGSLGQASSLLQILGVEQAPPALPTYTPPPAPAPNEQYTPGYWGYGSGGYSWVPGSWQQPPQTGSVWTPGYWGNQNGAYNWNPGYWGNQVGYYGGVDYGGGYPGTGFTGGQWTPSGFAPNTAALQTLPTNHTSYNGGPGGIQMHPNAQQLAIANERHIPMTPAQQAHIREAESDRNNLATVNHGRPQTLAVQKPYSAKNPPKGFKPITKADRDKAPHQRKENKAANTQKGKNSQNTGKDNQGKQNQGKHNQGNQNQGNHNQGNHNQGSQNQNKQHQGTQSKSHTPAPATGASHKKKPPSFFY